MQPKTYEKDNKTTPVNLIIDIGNTTAKVAFFDKGKMICRSRTDTDHLVELLKNDRHTSQCRQAIVSTTANLPMSLKELTENLEINTLWLNNQTRLPFVNDYKTPHTLGPDRVAAVAGAMKAWPEENVLVIDAGSCITYDLLTADGHYKGGNIAPGIRMRLKAMNEHTARLPLVETNGDLPPMGHDTETALRAGAMIGVKYEIEGYIHYLNKCYANGKVVVTGGDAEILKDLLPKTTVCDNHLVLRGLDFILQYNEKQL
ncbi:MAG: type III pantothenate kinase [Bacteroidaceae bacterium]